jgi:hypothetical protein
MIFNNRVLTSHDKHWVSRAQANRLKLFREVLAAYSATHMKHVNALAGHNAEPLANPASLHAHGRAKNRWVDFEYI